ncbi:MAG: sarcosine oxidase subunit delta [Geminicoccaceae bacterium]
MLQITCPWCGPRSEEEFTCGGEAHIVRPRQPASLSDDQWSDYLFMRTNPKGFHTERWIHSHGCGRWFNVARNTATDRILAVYKMGEACPVKPDAAPAAEPPRVPFRVIEGSAGKEPVE